jgi:hypothetical protein
VAPACERRTRSCKFGVAVTTSIGFLAWPEDQGADQAQDGIPFRISRTAQEYADLYIRHLTA